MLITKNNLGLISRYTLIFAVIMQKKKFDPQTQTILKRKPNKYSFLSLKIPFDFVAYFLNYWHLNKCHFFLLHVLPLNGIIRDTFCFISSLNSLTFLNLEHWKRTVFYSIWPYGRIK
jgi:hypothetical protein